MKVTLLSAEVGARTSGQSRFASNLSVALVRLGVEVTLVTGSVTPEARLALSSAGVEVVSLETGTKSGFYKLSLVSRLNRIGRRLGTRAAALPPAEWYVVMSDDAVSAIEALPGRRTAYISNGDLAVLFLSPAFYSSARWLKRLLAADMAPMVLRHGGFARRFDLLLANSGFTRSFMSYLYAVPFADVVYPPVDPQVFYPSATRDEPPFVFAVGRGPQEQNVGLLEELARFLPLRVAGGAEIVGASSVGRISDGDLARQYSSAAFLAFPIVSEFFGYAVAEALACGTPVLAMDAGGPAELIEPGVSGWLVKSPAEFVRTATDLFANGVPESFRVAALERSKVFSMEVVGRKFLQLLREAPPREAPRK